MYKIEKIIDWLENFPNKKYSIKEYQKKLFELKIIIQKENNKNISYISELWNENINLWKKIKELEYKK